MQSNNEHRTDACLATAIETTTRNFGATVLDEQRLIGILKDYHGFNTMPFAEHILRILINRHFLIHLTSLCKKEQRVILEAVHRESSILAREYGYSENKVKKTIFSVLAGLGYDNFNKMPESERKDADSFISIKTYPNLTNESIYNQKKIPEATTNQKSTYALTMFSLIIAALMVIGFCFLITQCQPQANDDEPTVEVQDEPTVEVQTQPHPPKRTDNEIRDSIYREVDSIRKANGLRPLFHTSPTKTKGKGKYRDSYEAAYEEGYEDGLKDQRFRSK